MHRRDVERKRTGTLAVAALLAVLLAVAAAAAVVLPGRLDHPAAPRPAPSHAGAPLPAVALPALAATASTPMPTAEGIRRDLAGPLHAPELGGVSAAVLDVATGRALLGPGSALVTPASTAKLVTAAAALTELGPGRRLTTRAVAGATPATVVLVGAGDPSLAGPDAPASFPQPARLADLAAGIAQSGLRRVDTVVVDTSLYTGPALATGWKPTYVTDGDVAPVSALMVDYGRVRPDSSDRVPNPALAAGLDLLKLLPRYGVTVPAGAGVTGGHAPPDARQLAAVSSPPLADLVELMLRTSNNDLAEALARLVAVHRTGAPASFADGAAAIRAAVGALGIPTAGIALVDGSGLSRSDRVAPIALARLLRAAADPARPQLRTIVSGLPVAGFAGTLSNRYLGAPGAGIVRAKTGTLDGVSALAGLVVDADGRLLAFDLTADHVPGNQTSAAAAALDKIAAGLAGCGCR